MLWVSIYLSLKNYGLWGVIFWPYNVDTEWHRILVSYFTFQSSSTCNLDKDDCDLKFKRCLYGYCKGKFGKKKKPLQYLDRQKCKLKAKLFYVTVVGVGCQAYRDAQKKACKCVKILERQRDTSNRRTDRSKDELWYSWITRI